MIRLVNRLLALTVGLGLAAGGVFVVIEAVAVWSGAGFLWIPGHQWLHTFKTTPWSSRLVIGVSAAVGALGLLIAALQLVPRRQRALVCPTETEETWLLLRRSTEAHLRRQLKSEVPADAVRTRLKADGKGWRLRVTAKAAPSARPALEQAAQAAFGNLHAPEGSRVQIRTGGTRRAS